MICQRCNKNIPENLNYCPTCKINSIQKDRKDYNFLNVENNLEKNNIKPPIKKNLSPNKKSNIKRIINNKERLIYLIIGLLNIFSLFIFGFLINLSNMDISGLMFLFGGIVPILLIPSQGISFIIIAITKKVEPVKKLNNAVILISLVQIVFGLWFFITHIIIALVNLVVENKIFIAHGWRQKK